jgi:hypothetical protein
VATRAELILDRCASPTVGRRRRGAYFVCGFSGYLAGLALVTVLGGLAGLDVAARLVLAIAPPASLLVAIKATQLLFGHERIVFYEQAIVTVGATALGGAAVGGPVATLVDLATLGVGTFLAFGRMGCFRVACCYGRRAGHGVAYREAHAAAGLPSRWVGVRLLPLQLADATLAATLVGLGTWQWLDGAPAGMPACVYVAGYGVGRFGLELWRGDAARPLFGGASEAQWTAAVTTAGAAAWFPLWWTLGAAAITAIGTMTLVVARRRGGLDRLWLAGPWHVTEVADHLGRLALTPGSSVTTSEGLRLSAARLPDGRLDLIVSRPLRPPGVGTVAAMAAQLGRPWRRWSVSAGRTPGLVHVILDDDPS